MLTLRMLITVSGKTYSAAMDPDSSAVPKESGWPTPTYRRVGANGAQYSYDVTEDQVKDIYFHLERLADAWAYGTDEDTRADARAIRKDMAKIADALKLRAEHAQAIADRKAEAAPAAAPAPAPAHEVLLDSITPAHFGDRDILALQIDGQTPQVFILHGISIFTHNDQSHEGALEGLNAARNFALSHKATSAVATNGSAIRAVWADSAEAMHSKLTAIATAAEYVIGSAHDPHYYRRALRADIEKDIANALADSGVTLPVGTVAASEMVRTYLTKTDSDARNAWALVRTLVGAAQADRLAYLLTTKNDA